MIDWLPPRKDESGLGLADYVLDFIPACLARVREVTREATATVLGYCMGGTLALLHAGLHPETVENLLLLATPVDFEQMALFRLWGSEKYFDVDRLVDALGNIPGEFILSAFDILRPANRTAGVLHLWSNMWNDDYVKSYRLFDRWAAETLPIAGKYLQRNDQVIHVAQFRHEGRNEIIGGRQPTCPASRPRCSASSRSMITWCHCRRPIPIMDLVTLRGARGDRRQGRPCQRGSRPGGCDAHLAIDRSMAGKEKRMTNEANTYPRRVRCMGTEVELRMNDGR